MANKKRYYPVRNSDNPNKVDLKPISEELYHALYPEIWRTQKKMKRSGCCKCPRDKLWICDADCMICPYHSNGNTISLDSPIDETEDLTIGDTIEADIPNLESILTDADLLNELRCRLDKLDPNGKMICKLIADKKSEREIASIMGKSQTTINYQKNKTFAILREFLKDYR